MTAYKIDVPAQLLQEVPLQIRSEMMARLHNMADAVVAPEADVARIQSVIELGAYRLTVELDLSARTLTALSLDGP